MPGVVQSSAKLASPLAVGPKKAGRRLSVLYKSFAAFALGPSTVISLAAPPPQQPPRTMSSQQQSASSRLVYGSNDALFGAIEKQQGDRPFGNFLDAGTGLHSLRWIATLGGDDNKGMTHYTAITADETMRRTVQDEANALGIGDQGEVIIGNWFADHSTTGTGSDTTPPLTESMAKGSYDTILADYLIGAMDGFSPYQQDRILPLLASYLKPGGRLYVVGLEPIPDSANGDADIVCRVRRIRDACILLAGHRCYREYPVEWIHRQFTYSSSSSSSSDDESSYEMKLLRTSKFPILYRHATIVKQINVARSKFKYFPSPELVDSMKKILDDLEAQSLEATQRSPNGRLQLGFDYVISAEKRSSTGEDGASTES